MNAGCCSGFLALALVTAGPALAQRVQPLDRGTYKVYQNERALGVETFVLERRGDSLVISAEVKQTLPLEAGEFELQKTMRIVVDREDFGLLHYESRQLFDGRNLLRALVLQDTSYVAYREEQGAGEGFGLVLPPGRVFVIDPHVFTLFDLVCRTLHGRTFERRPITLILLGSEDQVLDATVTDQGQETIRWGARPVQARKLAISDETEGGRFLAWVAPAGYLLRLEQPETGLRVEREPPPVKPARSRGG